MGTTHSLIMNQIGRTVDNQQSGGLTRPLPDSPAHAKHALVPNRNRLIIAANKLFSIITQLRRQPDYQDLNQLRHHLLKELQKFQSSAEKFGYDLDSIMISRYTLSACLDEIISQTSWGIKGNWKERGLLHNLNTDFSASERFFILLDNVCRTPEKFIDTIEMMYICLNLGFEGKFRNQTFERNRLQQVIDYTYRIIRKSRGEFDKYLSPSVPRYTPAPKRKFSFSSLLIASCLVMLGIYGSMNYLLRIYSNQAAQQLQSITTILSNTDQNNRQT